MRNPLKKIFGGEASREPKDHTVFAATLVPEHNSLSDNEHYKTMVARQRVDGMFEVAVEGYFKHRPTQNFVAIPHRPGNAEPQIVDGNTAYEMLMAFEDEHYSPGDGLTETLGGVGHATEMKDIAAQARVTAAEKSGGMAMKIATSHKQRRQKAKSL